MDKKKLCEIFAKNNICFDGEIIIKAETESTNTDAYFFAAQGKEVLIIAGRQTRGKGRFERTFISGEGGLYFSLVLRTDKKPIEIQDYPIKTGAAVKRVIDELYGVECEIKEPNDVLLYGKKICGILMEAIPHDDELFVIFGIGLNMENELPDFLLNAANLYTLTNKKTEQEICLSALVKEIKKICT